MKHNKHNK